MEPEEQIALVVPNSGVTVTLLGGSLASCSGLHSFLPDYGKAKRRVMILTESSHQSSPPTVCHINGGNFRKRTKTSEQTLRPKKLKQQKHRRSRSISPEKRSHSISPDQDPSNRSRKYMERRLNKDCDVRYIATLRGYIDKLIDSSGHSCYDCNQRECPSLQARLNYHRSKHHSGQQTSVPCCRRIDSQRYSPIRRNSPCAVDCGRPNVGTRSYSQQVKENQYQEQPRTLNPPCISQCTSHNENKGNHSVQTKITFADLGHLTITVGPKDQEININQINPEIHSNTTNPETNNNTDSETTRNYKSLHTLAKNASSIGVCNASNIQAESNLNYYRDNLRDEIHNWTLYIPFYPDTTPASVVAKGNAVNCLIERVYELSKEIDNPNYEQMVKYEIYTYLDSLKIWYPGARTNKEGFKQGMCVNLWATIKDINDKCLGCRSYDIGRTKRNGHYENDPCSNKISCRDQTVRCTVDSGVICNSKKKTRNGNYKNKCNLYTNKIDYEIVDWLNKSNLCRKDGTGMTKRTVINILIFRLSPYLNQPMTVINKNILREKIIEILEDLPISLNCPGNSSSLFVKLADDLANRLFWIQGKFQNKCGKCIARTSLQCLTNETVEKKPDLLGELRDRLTNIKLEDRRFIEEEILEIILENVDSIRSGIVKDVESDIIVLLQESGELTEVEMKNVVKFVLNNIKSFVLLDKEEITQDKAQSSIMPCNSVTISFNTSECEIIEPRENLDTTTKSAKRKSYVEIVSDLVKTWIETLPLPTQLKEDKQSTKMIINDLAGEITNKTMLNKIASEQSVDKNTVIKFLINKWFTKFNLLKDHEVEPHAIELVNRLEENYAQQKFEESYQECEPACSLEFFLSQARVCLLDEISVWMQEQPNKIYANNDKAYRNNKIRELVDKLQPVLIHEGFDKKVSVAIAEWLRKMLKREHRNKVTAMAVNLTERLKKVPLEETVVESETVFTRLQDETLNFQSPVLINHSTSSPDQNIFETNKDPDDIMIEFITKYIQHNYDVDDTMARGAFAKLLETELQKLSAPSRKELYENFIKTPQQNFSPVNLENELRCIKDITDWLKNIPLDITYNRRGNKKRIDFCINLAKDITSEESDRIKNPEATDYDKYTVDMIGKYMTQLPLNPNQKGNVNLMISQLLNKITASRQRPDADESYVTNGSPEHKLTDFIEDYIRLSGREIAEDELKLEAWSARLLKEIKQMICNHDPAAFTKTEVYNRLADQNIQGEETVKSFDIKLAYAEEISDWMKNLPLVHAMDSGKLHNMISELADTMTQAKRKKAVNPNDTQTDIEIENYIKNWISNLPLDKNKEVVVSIAIQQLMNRAEKVNLKHRSIDNVVGVSKKRSCKESGTGASPCIISQSSTLSKSLSNILQSVSKIALCITRSSSSINSKLGMQGQSHPESLIIKGIENWTENLDIEGKDDKDIKTAKNNIAKKLYQKIGELNFNPRFYNDNALYNEVLNDEIDVQLENLPQNMNLKGDRNQIKEGLLKTITELKRKIKDKTAGETYKHKLENTIESSMPNPVPVQNNDPGFKMYKNLLASMFILENFDHGNDFSKLKYEKKIKIDIDKYFQNAQKRNAIKLTKDQIYNELYSALFKVPMPKENYLAEEVLKVKTKCEIDDWFKELPIRATISDDETLKWDQKRSALSKRLFEIKNEHKSTDNIHKEITKWLIKLPIPPSSDMDELSNKLEIRLKSIVEERKCYRNEKPKTEKSISLRSESSQNTSGNSTKIINAQIPKKSADITIELVEQWCNELPIPAKTNIEQDNAKTLKEDILTKIIIKVSELNSNPENFNNDLMYNHLLDKELENLLNTLPESDNIRQTKDTRKQQLIEGLNSIKPLIREERARHEYRKSLNDTIRNILEKPTSNTAEKAIFINFRDEVVDDFIECHYNRDNDESTQFLKKKIHCAITDYLKKSKNDRATIKMPANAMIRGNYLIYELAKVPIPNEIAITDEIQEIRMKKQVGDFFDTISKENVGNSELRNQIKTSLAKRLNEIEKTSHYTENDEKMKREITKSLRKLGHEVSSHKIDEFINKLKSNEMIRKTPIRKYDSYPMQTSAPNWINNSSNSQGKQKCCGLPTCKRSRNISEPGPDRPGPSDESRSDQPSQTPGQEPQNQSVAIQSLLDHSFRPPAQGNVSEAPADYSNFQERVPLSSSKNQVADSFQRAGQSIPSQSYYGPAGVYGQTMAPKQQSFGPGSVSSPQRQTMPGGTAQFDFSQGPVMTAGGGIPQRVGQQSGSGPQSPFSGGLQGPVMTVGGGVPQRIVQQSFGPSSGSGPQWESLLPYTGGPQGSMMTPGSGFQQSFGPASGSGSQWESMLPSSGGGYPQTSFGPVSAGSLPYTGGPQQFVQIPPSNMIPQGFDASLSSYASSGQQRFQTIPSQSWQQGPALMTNGNGFGPISGSNSQWQSMLASTGGPQQLLGSQGQPSSPGMLIPPGGLEMSMSPYVTGGQPGLMYGPSAGPGALYQQPTGPSRQWESLLNSSPQQQYGSSLQAQGGIVNSLSESALGYSGFQVPMSSTRQDQFASSIQQPSGGQWTSLLSSGIGGAPMSYETAGPQLVGIPGRQVPPSDSMHPSGGSVQNWNTQSSGPQVMQQRAMAVMHDAPPGSIYAGQGSGYDQMGNASVGPGQISYPPQGYVSGGAVGGAGGTPFYPQSGGPSYASYGPGDAFSLQRGGRGAGASLGQSGVSYQGFQGAVPLSSSVLQSPPTVPGSQIIRGPPSPDLDHISIQQLRPETNQTLIPVTRSPQSVPVLPSTPGMPFMPGPGLMDSTLMGPYLGSPASAPQITPGATAPGATGQRVRAGIMRPDDAIAMSEDEDCICEQMMRMRRRRGPRLRCAIPLLEFCDSCQDFAPFFRPIPYPF